MINKPLKDIALADIQRLITEGVGESKTLEYKQELPGNGDGGQVKILRSISSLANTAGGDLLYGVAAVDGIPISLPGINTASQDETLLRLENLCRDGLSPRLPHIEFQFVPIDADRSVLVVRVRRSWSAPHRVAAGGHSHFYGRNAAGAYQLDVGELRAAFNLSESVTERIRAFRVARMLAIEEDEGPVRLKEGAKLILHLIPLSAFVSADSPVSFERHPQILSRMSPIGSHGFNEKYTLEGYATYTGSLPVPSRAYTLTFRSGIVEAVVTFGRSNSEPVIFPSYEREIINAVERLWRAQSSIGIEPPIYFMMSWVGVRGYSMAMDFDQPEPLFKDSLSIPEVILPDQAVPLAAILKNTFDTVANAFGLSRSPNYDSDGAWIARH